MWNNEKQQKLFSLMSNLQTYYILNSISKKWPNIQVVNLRHQTPPGQSVAKPGTPL